MADGRERPLSECDIWIRCCQLSLLAQPTMNYTEIRIGTKAFRPFFNPNEIGTRSLSLRDLLLRSDNE
jgi:hypothetical protein